MYRILQEEGIDLPRYAVLNRDPDKPEGTSVCKTSGCLFEFLGLIKNIICCLTFMTVEGVINNRASWQRNILLSVSALF